MATNLETLIFELIGRDKSASAAFDNLRRSVDGSTGSVDKNTKSLQSNQKAQTSALGGAIGLGVAFSAMATPLVAAGAGFTAFAGLAVPSITKIKTALTGPGGLQANLGTLDKGQQQVALSVQALGQQYSGLAKAMEPQVFQVFNTGLKLAGALLGPVAELAAAAGKGIESFLAGFTTGSGIQQFISFLSKEAGPALTLLGTDITNISHAVFALLESFGGLGMAELKAVTAVITGITGSLTWLSVHAPGLTAAGVALGGIALALAKFGVLGKVLTFTGLSAIAGQMTGFAAATRGATLAEKGFLAAETTIAAINPWVWAAAGVVAVGLLVDKIVTAKSSVQDLVDEMAKQNGATGLNVSGYQRLADALGKASTNYGLLAQNLHLGRGNLGGVTDETNALTAAQQKNLQIVQNLQGDFNALGRQYGVNTDQAKTLIVKSGALNDVLAANGRITPAAAEKIRAWTQTENKATGQTNLMAVAVKTLTDAMNKNVTVVLTLQGDELAWRSAMQQANAQLASNSAGLKGNSANAIANKQAVLGTTNAVVAFAKEQLTSKSNLGGASSEIQQQIRWLRGLHDQSGFTKDEIKVLVKWLQQIKSEQANIVVHGSGSWDVLPSGKHIPGIATGGRIPGYGGGDRWPALLEGGEAVVPKHLTPAVAPFLKAHGVPGFAAGGVAGSYSDGTPGLGRWLSNENAATLRAMEQSVATAILHAITTPVGFAGGPGGGAPAANARLARLMMPAWSGGAAWNAWNYVAMRESGWNQFARNPSSGAYGIPQALPPSKMGAAANPPQSNPAAQIAWMISYIQGRYGSPQSAAAHEMAFNWYDQGGYLPPGVSLAYNGTGRPEPVGGGTTIVIQNLNVTAQDPASLVRGLQAYVSRNGPIKLKVRS